MIQKLPLTLRRDTSGTCMVGIGGGGNMPPPPIFLMCIDSFRETEMPPNFLTFPKIYFYIFF